MKRYFALFLCLMLGLSGCVSEAPSETDGPSSTATAAPAFQEQVIADDAHCTIKITGIKDDPTWGYTLKVYLENKSDSTTYMMAVDTASINGVQADPLFAKEVAPGKKANSEISFSEELFGGSDIGPYSDIELNFRIYDSQDWSAEPVSEPEAHIYPLGEAAATQFTRPKKDTDTVLVDNEHVTVILEGFRQDEIWGYTADLFLVNKTDDAVMFSADEVSVNGFMVDPFYAESLEDGKCAFSTMSWSEHSFEESAITEVESVEFLLRVYDADDWDDVYVNQVFTLKP